MGSLCEKAPHRMTPVELEEILAISRKQYRAPQIDGEQPVGVRSCFLKFGELGLWKKMER